MLFFLFAVFRRFRHGIFVYDTFFIHVSGFAWIFFDTCFTVSFFPVSCGVPFLKQLGN